MKVALLIAGYLRSYDINLTRLNEQLRTVFDNVDTYLHITTDENSEDRYLNLIKENEVIDNVKSCLNPVSIVIESNIKAHENKKTNGLINHWLKLFKLNEIKKLNESASKEKYDLVIRYRPDIYLKDNIFHGIDFSVITIPKDSKIDHVKLSDKSDSYLCDALAFGTSESMDRYFSVYNNLEILIEQYGNIPEIVMFHHMNNADIKFKLVDIDYSFILSKCNTFAICGDSSSGKSTLSNILKSAFDDSFVLECDRYHKWERNDTNWENTTHLNPNANCITKMQEDVFNLKIGNHIYQVDYDHSNGKFTDKKQITPSDNLIVCGLHSLYGQQNSVYDLKIFMDTDRKLRMKWKINRDVKERGHTIGNVLDSIKKRESDYDLYVAPQKNYADVIVRFFSCKGIDLNDLQKSEELSLEISIDDKYNIDKIIRFFVQLNVPMTIEKQEKNTKLCFFEYKKVKFFDMKKDINTYTFYDYIAFTIINMLKK